MDTEKLRKLLDQRDEIDSEIVAVVGGKTAERAPKKCSKCGSSEHNARSCTAQQQLPT